MSLAFPRSTRALRADRFRGTALALFAAAALLAAWAAWAFTARVPILETSGAARMEVDRSAHPIEASVAGRIASIRFATGQEVRTGDVLLELDAGSQKLQLEEEETRLAAFAPQLEALKRELAAAEKTLSDLRESGKTAIEEAKARHKEAETAARFAKEEVDRKTKAGEEDLDLLRARAEAEKKSAAAETARLGVVRLEWEQRTKESVQQGTLEHLKREILRVEGESAVGRAAVRRLQEEIDKRRIRAPVDGAIGETADLRVGMNVSAGSRLGAVVPPGRLRLVADFTPSAALGRVRPGQRARIRLEGFAWTEYGMVDATVTRVASEVREGKVRVEFELHPAAGSRIPLQHGLPGTVEVEIDRVTPAALVLRALGGLFTGEPR